MRYLLAMAAILAAGPALAQEFPEGQSCGGLFCDLGIVGHKTAPAAEAPAALPAKAVPMAAPVPEAAAIVGEPRKRVVRRKRVAPVAVAATPAAPPTPVAAAPARAVPVVAVPVVAAVPVAPPAERSRTSAAAAPSPSDEPIIFMDPAGQPPPLANMFRPIYR